MDSIDARIVADNLSVLLAADSHLFEMLRYRVLAMGEAKEIGESVAAGKITVQEAATRMSELAKNQPYHIVPNKPATRGA